MVSEARMYQLLQNMARKELKKTEETKATGGGAVLSSSGLTYVSVGHRPSLLAFHDKRLRLLGSSSSSSSPQEDHERGGGGYEWSDIENKPTQSVVSSIPSPFL